MKLGMTLGPWDGKKPLPIELIQHAEKLGYDSVWSAETYGADCMTPLAFIAAHTKKIRLGTGIAQIDARTPANLAMCAMSVDALAGGGRMMLGLGVSGPQIVEGWYGRPWGKPNLRLRDYVAILKKVFRREYVAHQGHEIRLPYEGDGSSGLGKPLKTILHPQDIPVLLGTDTPLNVRMTAEVADGWLAMHVTPGSLPEARKLVAEGLAKRTDGMTMEKFEIHGTVGVKVNDDVKAALQEPKAQIALYAGGMGAKTKNFHKEAMIKRGYAEAAERIQELFLAGRKDEATAAVPDDYVDEEWLVGPPARIQERFKPWRDSGLATVKIRTASPEVLKMIAAVAD